MARVAAFVFLSLFTSGSSAYAVQLTAKFQNESGKEISAIHLTPMNAENAAAASILAAAVPPAQTADIAFEAQEGFCVFSMSIDFADGTSQTHSDVDLCEPSFVIVE